MALSFARTYRHTHGLLERTFAVRIGSLHFALQKALVKSSTYDMHHMVQFKTALGVFTNAADAEHCITLV